MRIYPTIFNIVFKKMDPELAHHVGYTGLRLLRATRVTSLCSRWLKPQKALECEAMGLTFPTPFGVAAGFDKAGLAINALTDFGFGHVEVGTVTGQAQPGNPKKRLFRLVGDKAVINRMGFNNDGAAKVAPRLRRAMQVLEREYGDSRGARPVLGINIGKTKVVELENAEADYRLSTREVATHADYLVVNVSSPNTPGLRTLQSIETLRPLLMAVREEADAVVSHRHVPLLVKIAPDLADEDVIAVAELARELRLDGIIATNTTIAREGLGLTADPQEIAEIGAGGLSGQPLKRRSLEVTQLLRQHMPSDMTLISVGGVSTAEDVQERLDAGANLVQGYTAFLYEGPLWAWRINKELVKIRRKRQQG
ncbi:quinone-dependent dihydroorotate dehydrogenase [Rothia sp. LK2588]|uniref:quinone-dependent dihydroorotate dehydrogenase n=1 Tax=Rothia sp. LK2588 TaxID=3114369 RepID=UPI0034CE7C59